MPAEFRDWLLMRHMRWPWRELRATPDYVKQYTFDLLQAEFRHERDQAEAVKRDQVDATRLAQQGG